MLRDILKPNAAIEETARTTPKYSFWGCTWRYLLVYLLAMIPAYAIYFGAVLIYVFATANEVVEELTFAEQFISQALLLTVFSLCIFAVVHLYCHKASARSYFSMGLTKKGAVKHYLFGILLGAIACAVKVGVAVGCGAFAWNKEIDGLLLLMHLSVVLLTGLAGELFATGYYFGSVASSKGTVFALFGYTAVSFLMSLLSIQNGIVYVLASMMTALLSCLYFLYSGNIWGAAALSGMRAFASDSLYVAQETSQTYQILSDVTSLLLPLIGIAILVYLLYRKHKRSAQ